MKALFNKNKKGVFGLEALPNVAMAFMLTGILFAVAAIVLASFQSDTSVSTNTDANASIANALEANTNVTGKLPLIGTIIVLGLIVLIVLGVFVVRKMRG